jgi:trimeric autotransporter adhesin
VTVGTGQQLTATGRFADGSMRDLTRTAAWNSSDFNTISVNSTGLVVANRAGRAIITATLGSVTGQTTVTGVQLG